VGGGESKYAGCVDARTIAARCMRLQMHPGKETRWQRLGSA
jgi:hypothetical protein